MAGGAALKIQLRALGRVLRSGDSRHKRQKTGQ